MAVGIQRCLSLPGINPTEQRTPLSLRFSNPVFRSRDVDSACGCSRWESSSTGSPRRQTGHRPGGGVWRSAPVVPSPLPPLAKGASRHRRPGVEVKVLREVGTAVEHLPVDFEASESYGRRRLGDDARNWAEHVFQNADMSQSGYLCPPEFAAVVASLKLHLGTDASMRFLQTGLRFNSTYADTSLEGRVSLSEWCAFAYELQETFGLQRCVRAAARYLGTRQAEARRRVKSLELFEGYSADASLALLTSCSNHSSSTLFENVRAALDNKADPNASLTDPLHNGYSPLIWLAKTPPTAAGGQVAKAVRALLAAKADPHRESGEMPFGKWMPLRFAAFMQNIEGLAVLLRHVDAEDVLGDRFQWAANENVEHVMLQELRREHSDELVSLIAQRSRYSRLATVLLQQYASPIAGGSLTPSGAKQLINGEFVSGNLPRGARANPNGAGLEGRTALMDVVEAGDVKTVRALLENVADPNRRDSSGATALHVAAIALQVEAVRVLLDAHADPSAVDHCGFSPWMVVGEEMAPTRGQGGVPRAGTNGRSMRSEWVPGRGEARRELLELLRPQYTPEEFLERLSQGWEHVLDPDFAGPDISVEALAKRFRLSESLFFSSKLADGHGAHEGRMERTELLLPFATHLMQLLRTEHLAGKQKVLTRYLLRATTGPAYKTASVHVATPWPTQDNRLSYRSSLNQVIEEMLWNFGEECDWMREIILFKADMSPECACGRLSQLDKDIVTIPVQWQQEGFPDYLFWREVQRRQKLRYDPLWALEVGGSPARCCVALLRLEAAKDLEECAELNQVYHASLSELFARGYVQYSKLCNEAFQQKLKAIGRRCAERDGVRASPPQTIVASKKLERVMEKIQESKAEFGNDVVWPGRPPEYLRHSHAFNILDTVRSSFTCHGDIMEEQVDGCMKLLEEFKRCTVEKDGLCVLRCKSGFAPGVEAAGGYADVKLLVYADLGTHRAFDGTDIPLRIVGEVQLILEGYMRVKSKMHLVYEVHRGSFDRNMRPMSR